MIAPRVTARDLSLTVAGKRLCTDMNVEFCTGENWAVLGANGSGKTTLLHVLAGLRAPASGAVLLDQQPIAAYSARARAQRVALLFQDHEPAFPATVMETVLTGRHPYLGRWQWERDDDRASATAALAAVGAAAFTSRRLDTLSGGERRRVEIAAVLAQNAPIALYDEPTNHLDLRHQHEILDLLVSRTQTPDRLNIFVLHDVNLAARVASHALLMLGAGQWIAGKIADVLNVATLERVYGCRLRELRDDSAQFYIPM